MKLFQQDNSPRFSLRIIIIKFQLLKELPWHGGTGACRSSSPLCTLLGDGGGRACVSSRCPSRAYGHHWTHNFRCRNNFPEIIDNLIPIKYCKINLKSNLKRPRV